jgi:hypothetical protein
MISDREAEIINKLLDITEKERDKIWFFSSVAPYVILENPLPPHMKEMIEEFVAPIRDVMDLQYFLRLFEVPELKEIYENAKGSREEKESKFVYSVNNMIEKIAHDICNTIKESEGDKARSKFSLTLYKCYHPKTGTFYLTTYVELYYEPFIYYDFSFYLTRDKLRAYELYTETKRKHALQRKTSTEKAESAQMLES